MSLEIIGNGELMCDQCGQIVTIKDDDEVDTASCPNCTPREIVLEDLGFGKAAVDLEKELEKENQNLKEALADGSMKLALMCRDRIRRLVGADISGEWRIGGDGRATRRWGEAAGVEPGAEMPAPNSPMAPPVNSAGPIWPKRRPGPDSPAPTQGAAIRTGATRGNGMVGERKTSTVEKKKLREKKRNGEGGGSEQVVMGPEQVQANIEVKKGRTAKEGRQCACGCGRTTGSVFAMGHDSKVKAMCRKVDEGELTIDDLAENIKQYYLARKEDPSLKLSEWFGG